MSDTMQTTEQEFAGSSKAVTDSEEYQKKTSFLDQLIADGDKLKLAENFAEAADKYEEALKTATEYFGQFAHECYTPALNFGKCLIEIARINSQPINAPMEGIEEEDEEGEEEAGEEQAVQEQVAANEGSDKNENGMGEGEPKEQKENGTKPESEGMGEVKTGEAGETKDETLVEENGTDKTTEEDVDDEGDELQSAWEWLEVASKICEKQEQSNYWLNCKAEVLVAQGECCTVSDEFENALGEFQKALEIRQKISDPIDRRIAEIYYFLGLTLSNLNEFRKAAEQFELAKGIMLKNIEITEKEIEGKENEAANKLKGNVEELKKVVESIDESIKDAIDSAETREVQLALREQLRSQMAKLSTAPPPVDGIKVNDLSAMVKRKPMKRPVEAKDGGEQQLEPSSRLETAIEELKQKTGKVELENGQNGDNNHANGNGTGSKEGKPVEKRQKLDVDEEGKHVEEKSQ